MTPEQSLQYGLTEHQSRLIVIEQQLTVLLAEKFRTEQRMHDLVATRIGYIARNGAIGGIVPNQREEA